MTNERAQTELAERCEKAAGSDRKLDVLIEWPEVFEPLKIVNAVGSQLSVYWNDDKFCRSGRVRSYTASLDAAMTLVPEDYSFAVGRDDIAADALPAGAWAWCRNEWREAGYVDDLVVAETPALALCAAALRARSQ